ncbi:hypothetical protein COU54_01195 [Candidatus Pacearchaeota archaeon CG10_big_fil_rev_8_21_14_0_10_31_24]|nr:MAG: hypothetical protein COU54_01195 [Candidatus Pacearchaeota archaeon CG10_big_fil_rev_8_21_14_0_10_31_24]
MPHPSTTITENGHYTIRNHARGGKTIYGPHLRKRGVYIPSDEKIRKRGLKEYNNNKKLSKTTMTYLGYRSLAEPNITKREVNIARKAIGLRGPKRKNSLEHNNGEYYIRPDEIKRTITSFWKHEKVQRYLNGQKQNLPRIVDFEKQFRSVYNCIIRTGRFGDTLESIYPGLYALLSKRTNSETINPRQLAEDLKFTLYTGNNLLTRGCLEKGTPEEKRLKNQILFMMHHFPKYRKLSFCKSITKLTGIPESELKDISNGIQQCAQIGEKITQLYFTWALATGLKNPWITNLGIYETEQSRTAYIYDSQKHLGIADRRIGDLAIEVKIGKRKFSPESIDTLCSKYTPNENRWESGEIIPDSFIFFHMDEQFHSLASPVLKNVGIRYVKKEAFRPELINLVNLLEKDYSSEILDIQMPRIHKVSSLLDIYEEISDPTNLGFLMMNKLRDRREFMLDLLNEVISLGEHRINHGA